MQNVWFFVFDEQMDKVLLSRPLLSSMAFDINTHLENLQQDYHDVDFFSAAFYSGLSENDMLLPQIPSKLAKVMLRAKDDIGEAVLYWHHIDPDERFEESPDRWELLMARHDASTVNKALQGHGKEGRKGRSLMPIWEPGKIVGAGICRCFSGYTGTGTGS